MKNKTDILYLFLIISFAIFSFVLFKENIYSPYSDIGREFYITEQIKEGAILYKDILNVYSPLGYWTNALITKLLGNNLNIFYGIGLVLSILTLIPIYLTHFEYILALLLSLFNTGLACTPV